MSEIHERNEPLFPAEKVKELRLLLGCSQEEFSKIMGVTVAFGKRWTRGKTPRT
jgi:transcriptional regulator with XRE-family HTH domain